MPDADPRADGLVCSSGTVTYALGCVVRAPAHCARPLPSNGVEVKLYDHVSEPNTLAPPKVFNTDTGEVGGSITRTAGQE